LKGSAAGLLKDCREDVKSYKSLEAKLRQRFDAKGREVSFRAQLRARRRQRGESLQELYIGIGDLMHQAYPGKGSVHRDIAACDAFIDALDDPALEQRVRDKLPDNLDEAYRLAVVLEANSRGAEFKVSADKQRERGARYDVRGITADLEASRGSADVYDVRAVQTGKQDLDLLKEEVAGMKSNVEKLYKIVADLAAMKMSEGSGPSKPGGGTRFEGRCFKCDQVGHFARKCPSQNTVQQQDDRGRDGDHGEQQGVMRNQGNQRAYQARGARGGAVRAPMSCIGLEYRDQVWTCALDSGADCSMVPARLIRQEQIRNTDEKMRAINGQSLRVIGRVEVVLKLNGRKLETSLLVVDGIQEPTLGLDWMRRHHVMWEFHTDTVVISEMEVPLVECEDAVEPSALGLPEKNEMRQQQYTVRRIATDRSSVQLQQATHGAVNSSSSEQQDNQQQQRHDNPRRRRGGRGRRRVKLTCFRCHEEGHHVRRCPYDPRGHRVHRSSDVDAVVATNEQPARDDFVRNDEGVAERTSAVDVGDASRTERGGRRCRDRPCSEGGPGKRFERSQGGDGVDGGHGINMGSGGSDAPESTTGYWGVGRLRSASRD
jgi:predicted aspartyl protease